MTPAEQFRAGTLDVGLLVLRVGALAILGFLFAWRFPNSTVAAISGHAFRVVVVVVLGAFSALGLAARPAAALTAAAMAWSLAEGLRHGQQFLEEPVRALMLVIIYSALACTGGGRWSLDLPNGRLPPPTSRNLDAGLLLLRLGSGLSLFVFFGITKIGWVLVQLHGPQPWSQWDFAKLIAVVGFPAPLLLSLCAVANETVISLLVAAGVITRLAAAVGAIGMSGAMYTSMRLQEEPLRAATYLVAFAGLALTGGGRRGIK